MDTANGYFPVRKDEGSTTQYFAFLNAVSSNWYIVKATDTEVQYFYSSSSNAYPPGEQGLLDAWSDRASLNYGYPKDLKL